MRMWQPLFFSLALSILLPLPLGAEIAVIVNPANPVSSLTSEDIQQIYRFKKIFWNHGKKISPVDLPAGDPSRKEFSEHLLERDREEMEQYYLMRALSGKGQPPPIARSPDEVKTFIRREKNAIGYIDTKDVDASVKVIIIRARKSGR